MDPFWTSDPTVLFKPDAILEVVPSSSMPLSERYNALARLAIVIAIIAALVIRKLWPLAIGAAVLLLDWVLYKSKAKSASLQEQQQRLQYQRPMAPAPTMMPLSSDQFSQPQQQPQPQPDQRPLSNWEAFMKGPGENQVNGVSGCEQVGVNPSHSDQFRDRSHPWELSGLPSTGQPLPTAGTNGPLPDLDFSAVPGTFESKRLPKGFGDYSLGTGTAMDSGAVAGRSARPIQNSGDQLVPRPTSLMFQGRQQLPNQLPTQMPTQIPNQYLQQQLISPPQSSEPTPQEQQLAQQPASQLVQQSLAQSPYPHSGSPEPLGQPSYLPCKPWHLMNQAEQLNALARQKRDGFLNRLFDPLDTSLNNRTWFNLPNYSEIEDRELFLTAMQNDQSHFKDRWTNWAEKYF